ncbi:polysaccharide lyase family 7 protein [Flammeovirga yaeyamensis]|uniref:Polysaccharide lyase family 7 protein n=1 Tax=Flammeovirga yaeyamensis TaxID=367791 RepID=A0AAX1NB41_9BACT|nr:polysaccharide lyase family 7 protein [Flammeovirga yaeyamensis]MBB3699873.1 hypothetical protein [Flammeovirga yaeyamensis]NMF38330.1 hypothetical protein [Flammeovirga yaeyamensis]QWG04741.1 polysaccharide lyase family 7 protein [Flammeovirga yaeyamensis]
MNNQYNVFKNTFNKMIVGAFLTGSIIGCTNQQNEVSIEKENEPSNLRTTVTVPNASFESSWTNWTDSDPSAISGDANTGTKSAKITGSGGSFSQDISINSNANYELSAFVKGSWRISATVDGVKTSRSGNASDWTQEVVSFNSGSGSTVTIKGEYYAGEGRYDDFSLIEVDGGTTPPPSSGTEPLTAIAVVASSDDGNVPSNTVDGNLGTRWSANGSGQWIRYDFGSVKNIEEMKVAWFKGDVRSSTFEVLAGNATDQLTVVYSGVSSGNTLELENVSLNGVSGRYVQIIGYGNSSNTWNSITEVTFAGTDGEGNGTDPVDPVDPPTGGGGYPYDVLGLQNWKLNAFSGTLNNPTFVDNTPNLSTYENDNWFYTDGTNVFFKCYAGYPTSSGSGNPRTELRELTADGSSNIYWDGGSGINRMEWKVTVNQLPSSGKVCFGQIHGPSNSYDDVIRVQYEGDPNQSSGSARLKIMGWVTEENDDMSGDFIDGNWALDQEMHLELVFENSNVVLYNLANGGRTEIYRFNGCNSDSNYFKAGNYMQSMKGKSLDTSDYGIVSISYLKVSH